MGTAEKHLRSPKCRCPHICIRMGHPLQSSKRYVKMLSAHFIMLSRFGEI